MRNITRRSAINTMVGAAGLSVIPVAASAAALVLSAHPDAALFALEQKLAAVERHIEIVFKPFTRVEDVMIEWRKANPWPAQREATSGIIGSPKVFEVSAMEHKKAIQRWRVRARAAERKCRFREVEAEYNDAVDEAADLYDEIAEVRATTFDGLKCKARVADRADALNCVANSIVSDLLAMTAVS
jgi:hypothetical protein